MYGFAGNNPEPLSRIEPRMSQQTDPPLGCGIGNLDPLRQNGITGLIAHQ
jgi:hypothetical protein